jgi:tetratricopeptide (TPR) repeat protein
LRESLGDGGFLVLGHSESLWQMDEGFTLVEDGGAFCYRKVASHPEAQDLNPRRADSVPIAPRIVADTSSSEYDRSLAAFRAGEWTQAERMLQRLIRSSPAFVPASLLLGGVYVHRGRYEEAFEQAKRVLHLNDLEPRAHLLLGMIAARRGQPDEALQALRRALYLDDSLGLAHFWLGNLYRDRGDFQRARQEYRNVVHLWEQHTLELTEIFASDLSAEQLVNVCRRSVRRLKASNEAT